MNRTHNKWRLYESYRKLLLNLYFSEDPDLIQVKEKKLNNFNEKIRKNGIIKLKIYPLDDKEEDNYNYLVIDFEGENPLKLFGLYFNGHLYSYLLNTADPSSADIKAFYQGISDVLSVFQGFLTFGFTFWDYELIQSIQQRLNKNTDPHNDILYFNLQSRDRESVSEALYSIGESLPRDPLYRSNRKINQLHKDGFFDIIRKHNGSCIRAAVKILRKRFLPQHLIR